MAVAMDGIFLKNWPKGNDERNSAPSIGGEDSWPSFFYPISFSKELGFFIFAFRHRRVAQPGHGESQKGSSGLPLR
jgi:hypothetical protein